MLEKYRDKVRVHIESIARPFLQWDPNNLSWLSFILSAVAAGLLLALRWLPHASLFVPFLFFEAATFIFVGGVFDALDGYVARHTGKSSKRGDFLDHVLDRYADVVILVGLSFSGWVNPYLGLLALVSMLLSSYMGTQAQAVSGKRAYGGLLGRADRIVLISLACLVMTAFTVWNIFATGSLRVSLLWQFGGLSWTPLDVLLGYFLVAGQVTSLYRGRHTWRDLGTG